MAFPATYVNAYTLSQAVVGTAVDYDTHTHEVELYTSAFDGASINKTALEGLGSTPWSANKVDYTGASPAGRNTLTTPAIDLITTPADAMRFRDAGAATSVWTNGTFTADGCGVFNTTHASDLLVAALAFGSGKQVIGGTLTITWDASNGIFVVTV
ncbi:MAG: hypothetical protein ACF8PN_04875 [Phycisphaerales bacterium]